MTLPKASKDSRQANSTDVARLYQLVHQREAETDAAIEGFVGLEFSTLTAAFLGSGEFVDRVIGSAGRGENIWGVNKGPPQDLIDWAASKLPLSKEGVGNLRAWADSWPGTYFALLSDPMLRAAVGPKFAPPEGALSRLRAFAGLITGVERIDASIVSGWAMMRGPHVEPVDLEVWAGDVFVGAGRADRFRRDIQDLFGGDGRVGFEIRLAGMTRLAGRPLRIEIRIASTGERIAEGEIHAAPPVTTGLSALRSEVAVVRATLERLERALPAITSSIGRPLADYGDYYEEWGRRPVMVHEGDRAVTVFLDAFGANAVSLDRSARAVQMQLGVRDRLVLIVDRSLANMATDICNRTGRTGSGSAASIVLAEPDPGLRLRAALSAETGGEIVVLTDADAILSGDALARMADAFRQSDRLEALYADEDRLEPAGEGEAHLRRHADPVLRPGYDHDLLLQLPYIGTTLALRRATLDVTEPGPGHQGLHGCDIVLRLGDRPGAVGHIATVLATRVSDREIDSDGLAWAGCVREELSRQAVAGEVERQSDILGVRVPGAIRVRRHASAPRVSVIVPTHDRMDLLKPCVQSILLHRKDNRAELELLIIDHESEDAGTQAYLAELVRNGDAKVITYAGIFNWALMNNLAAAEATGEVLVFLNNDTVVLSPDWLDELAGQALRPDVGVVGARLLYADGTIQHAGFVSRDANKDFLIHDGVGVPGSDGGYLGRHALVHASPVVTGACMAVRTQLFLDLGGFDAANFPLEGNDADFCYRARAEGLAVLYDPYATLYHLESKTRGFSVTGEDRATSLAAQALLRERWGERFGEDAGFNPHFDRTGRPFDRLRPPSPDFRPT